MNSGTSRSGVLRSGEQEEGQAGKDFHNILLNGNTRAPISTQSMLPPVSERRRNEKPSTYTLTVTKRTTEGQLPTGAGNKRRERHKEGNASLGVLFNIVLTFSVFLRSNKWYLIRLRCTA